jgi:hypothetical protein
MICWHRDSFLVGLRGYARPASAHVLGAPRPRRRSGEESIGAGPEELFVHKNTVAERIKRAEEMLGGGVNESPLELEAALTLAVTLGDADLGDADGVVVT